MQTKKLILLTGVVLLMSMAATHKKIKVVFFGDSITQMGINKGGYIDRIQSIVDEKGLKDKYDLVGAGVGGNKIYHLFFRLNKDVLEKNPDIVVMYIGINDVWHKTSGIGTDINDYKMFYEEIIRRMQAKKIKLILCTPSVIGEKKHGENPQDKDLDEYAQVVRDLAVKYNCKLVDLRKIFEENEVKYNTTNVDRGVLTMDLVHLTDKGNKIVANAVWDAISSIH